MWTKRIESCCFPMPVSGVGAILYILIKLHNYHLFFFSVSFFTLVCGFVLSVLMLSLPGILFSLCLICMHLERMAVALALYTSEAGCLDGKPDGKMKQ